MPQMAGIGLLELFDAVGHGSILVAWGAARGTGYIGCQCNQYPKSAMGGIFFSISKVADKNVAFAT
jgi:hypothetical protein